MAEIVVRHLLERLSSLIEEEGKLLGGLGRDVNEVKDDLEAMRSFLRDADSRGETDQRVKTWVKQVRDVAYDTEDVLEEFMLRLVRPRRNRILDSLLHKLHYIKHLKTRHRLAIKIQDIKATLKSISERRIAFAFTNIGEGTRAYTTPDAWHDPRFASLHIDETEVVGIKVPKNKLITWLTEGESELTMISVVGMGGLGKTTLVKKVYDSQIVKKHFGCHAWITVSKSPVIGELLGATIKGVRKAMKQQALEGMDAMNVNELIEVLKNQLGDNRYVVIFDDIWDINVWEVMKFAFPKCDCGSRIIFTTRTREFAKYTTDYVLDLEPLPKKEALLLFCMKAFGSKHKSSSCPEGLEELSQDILKKCDGLPLAIVLIGGLLSRKAKTVLEWTNFHASVGAEMRKDYDLESLSRIILLSYNNLPYYLKSCYLYLSMFPEDYFIKRMAMIRLWIAEGLVEEKQGVTMEVVAGGYVSELINRSMLQVAELNDCNDVKSCRIHDLIREIIQSKCKEERFSTTMIGSEGMQAMLTENPRRLSIYHNSTYANYYSMGSRCLPIRSLMIFQLDESPWLFRDEFFRAFRFLRVLDLGRAPFIVFPPVLVELIHLRYLSLRSTKITVLPKSVGKLKNLETLDLKQTHVSVLPVEILKLQRLRHLLVYRNDLELDSLTTYTYGVSVPTWRIGTLTSLQKLAFLDVHAASDVLFKELGKLTQLRRLGLKNLRCGDGRDLCLALGKMKHLHSLDIARSRTTTFVNGEEEEVEFLDLELLVLSPPELLRHLYLYGRLVRLPIWILSLMNLGILGLRYSRLSCEEDDPLKAFQHLPNLMCLYLQQAYEGEELCCTDVGGYKKLKELFLWKMEGLKRVRFMKGSMPVLRELNIRFCPALKRVPYGIEHLSSLQELTLYGVHTELVASIGKKPISPPPRHQGKSQGGKDWWRVEHIPTIKYPDNTQGTFVADNLRKKEMYCPKPEENKAKSSVPRERSRSGSLFGRSCSRAAEINTA